MSTNWIDDAKNQILQKRLQEEEKEKKDKEYIELIHETALARQKQIFHQKADFVIAEIEAVMAKARNQGLKTSGPFEGEMANGPGNLITKTVMPTRDRDANGENEGTTVFTYGIGWSIEEPNEYKGMNFYRNMNIYLGINSRIIVKHSLLGKRTVTESYNPTITASEVEAQIKVWLVKIYSE